MAIKGAPFEIHITIKNLTLVQIFYCLRVKIRSILIHFDFKCVGVLGFWGTLKNITDEEFVFITN